MADNEKEGNVSKVFTPFGVMVGAAGAMKSFDDASFYEEVLKPSEKATYEKYKKDFLKNPRGKVKKLSAGFTPWSKLVIQSKARNLLLLDKIQSNTWALNKEAIPGFIDLIEKLRGKYSTVIGDDKLLEYLEAAQHRARELEASGEVSGSSSKPETNSSRNALRSAYNVALFNVSRAVSQSVRYTGSGIPVQDDPYEVSDPCFFVGHTPVWVEQGSYHDQFGKHEGFIVRYESPLGDWCSTLSFPKDTFYEDLYDGVVEAIEADGARLSTSSVRKVCSRSGDSFGGFSGLVWLRGLCRGVYSIPEVRKGLSEAGYSQDKIQQVINYYMNNKPEIEAGARSNKGSQVINTLADILGSSRYDMGHLEDLASARRIKSNAEDIDQQAYENYVQQLVAMGIPEDQARQQADQLVTQLKQNTAQFAQNMQQPDQQGSMGLAASFKRCLRSGFDADEDDFHSGERDDGSFEEDDDDRCPDCGFTVRFCCCENDPIETFVVSYYNELKSQVEAIEKGLMIKDELQGWIEEQLSVGWHLGSDMAPLILDNVLCRFGGRGSVSQSRSIKSGYVDPQIAGVNSVPLAFRQEFRDILDLWLAGELTDDEAVNSLVAGGLMSHDQADETVYEWQSKYEDDEYESSGSDLTDADDVYGYQMDGIALPPKGSYE